MVRNRRYLIYDSVMTGHHGEYLEHLIVSGRGVPGVEIHVLAHPELKSRLGTMDVSANVEVSYLDAGEIERISSLRHNLRMRGEFELGLVANFLKIINVDHVVLMHLNLFLKSEVRLQAFEGVEFSGILFNQEYQPLWGIRSIATLKSWGEQQLRNRDIVKVRRVAAVRTIHVLNDCDFVEQMNAPLLGKKPFNVLVDPLPLECVEPARAISSTVKPRATELLLFGAISPRKGVLETLRALERLTSDEKNRIHLTIAGKFVNDAYAEEVRRMVDAMNEQQEIDIVRLIPEFLEYSELDKLLENADCVLAPYIGFYGSSGIIGHACRWQVPVIACKAGLIGRIVLRNRLGWTVDPSNVGQFASVIRSVCRGHTEFSEENANDYARLASSQAFVSALLSS